MRPVIVTLTVLFVAVTLYQQPGGIQQNEMRSSTTSPEIRTVAQHRSRYRPCAGLPVRHRVVCLIKFVFRAQAPRALRVGVCESGLRPWARNRKSSAAGIFQLVGLHYRGRFDPLNGGLNIRYSWHLSRRGTNWRPWNASRGCWA